SRLFFLYLFPFHPLLPPPDLHSFPTRRSSDLWSSSSNSPCFYRSVRTARRNRASVGRASNTEDFSGSGQGLSQFQSRSIPQFELAWFAPIAVAGNERAAIRRKGERPNIAFVGFDTQLLPVSSD